MDGIDTARQAFDAAWERVDFDLKVYTGEYDDDPDETDADKRRELAESLRMFANAAFAFAVELNAPQ